MTSAATILVVWFHFVPILVLVAVLDILWPEKAIQSTNADELEDV